MPDPSSRFAAFIAELRRRRVFRVAVGSWCVGSRDPRMVALYTRVRPEQ